MQEAGDLEPESTDHPKPLRRTGGFIISGLTSGHGVFHWFLQSFLVMLPEVKAAFNLSEVGVGAITTTRELSSGMVTLPGGVVADVVRRHWGIILALCMGGFGGGWLLIGVFPSYWVLLLGIVVTSVAASIWHLPAMAALSHHFEHRRGTALSFHGIGGNIGDFLAPIVTGMLLGILSWQGILSIYAVVPLLLMFVVYWAFRDIGHTGNADTPTTTLKGQLHLARQLLKNRPLMGITLVEGLRGMAFLAVITFLPLYLDEIAHLTQAERGLYLGLLMVMGIPATPTLGYISDIIGRKMVLVPALLSLAGMTLLLVGFGTGPFLIIILILMGLFLYSDQPILTAAALDIVGREVATTTMGILAFSRLALAAASPMIAGLLWKNIGSDAAFYYAASLFVLSALILFIIPMAKPAKINHSSNDS